MIGLLAAAMLAPTDHVSGDVRVQFLTPWLVRLEQRGPDGFEDRPTFHVVKRDWDAVPVTVEPGEAGSKLISQGFTVVLPSDCKSLAQVRVLGKDGKLAWSYGGELPRATFLPGPNQYKQPWAVADTPRLVPPAWGATPAPPSSDPGLTATSGWDTGNDAPDIYLFLPGPDGFARLRKDYLALTGPVPLPAMPFFGLIHSRYHPYTQDDAVGVIEQYRKLGFPLDMFVIDTDWRKGASHGYEVNTELFPDIERFFRECKARGVFTMANDHPEPVAPTALEPEELDYRFVGLTSLLSKGLDYWWFDRNWHTSLKEPMPGLAKELWGARLFRDIALAYRPELRPTLMSNVQGVDNGLRNYAPQPAFHRYPIWWTGDTVADFAFLRRGVENAVDLGAVALLPYVGEDIGGHAATPTAELYVRFVQFGALSPTMRLHCTRGEQRYPWGYGPEAQAIALEYSRLRYRLLPMLYSAARRTMEDGTPILRRLDLSVQGVKEAEDSTQYLLGDHLLVAPILESRFGSALPIPGELLRTPDGKPGLQAEYFAAQNLNGARTTRVDAQLNFDWKRGPAWEGGPVDNFSARWTGKLGPAPVEGEYVLETVSDDGIRVFIDGKPLIQQWRPMAAVANRATVRLTKGQVVDLKVEFFEAGNDALVRLGWLLPGQVRETSQRSVWVPPGEWMDLWTGKTLRGPAKLQVEAPLRQTPLYARAGGVVLAAPDMQWTSQKPWDPVTVHWFPAPKQSPVEQVLYEDDGLTNGYERGEFAKTTVRCSGSPRPMVEIGARQGSYKGAVPWRGWVVKVHLPPGRKVTAAKVDGKPVRIRALQADPAGELLAAPGRPSPTPTWEIEVPPGSVTVERKVLLALSG